MFKDVIGNIPFIKQEAIYDLSKLDEFEELKNSIIAYCAKSDIFISDIRFLMRELMLFRPFEIYTTEVFRHASGLANYLYTNLGRLVKARTIIENEIITVEYDGNIVATINRLESVRDFPIESIVFPIRAEIAYFPPEIEMIDVYRTLYSPHKTDLWSDALFIQRRLFKNMINRLSTYHNVSLKTLRSSPSKAGGGGETETDSSKSELESEIETKAKDCKLCKTDSLDKIKKFILRHLAKHFVLVGNFGIWLSTETEMPERDLTIVQVVTENEIMADILLIKNALSKITDSVVTYEEQKLHIPKDLITKRIRIFVSSGDRTRRAVMDIFNSGQFELIPFNTVDGYRIGNPFVIARFMLIDLWIYKIIRERNLIDPDKADRLINQSVKLLSKILERKYEKLVFGLEYFGIFKDPEIMKKIEKQKSKKKMYFPEIYEKNNGKLLSFQR